MKTKMNFEDTIEQVMRSRSTIINEYKFSLDGRGHNFDLLLEKTLSPVRCFCVGQYNKIYDYDISSN